MIFNTNNHRRIFIITFLFVTLFLLSFFYIFSFEKTFYSFSARKYVSAKSYTNKTISNKHNSFSQAQSCKEYVRYHSTIKPGQSDYYYFNTNAKIQDGHFLLYSKKYSLTFQLYDVYGNKISCTKKATKNAIQISYRCSISRRAYFKVSCPKNRPKAISYVLTWTKQNKNVEPKNKKTLTKKKKVSKSKKKPISKKQKKPKEKQKAPTPYYRQPSSPPSTSTPSTAKPVTNKPTKKKKKKKVNYYISLSKQFLRIKTGEKNYISTSNNLTKNDCVLWKSCDKAVASVSAGHIVAKKQGITVIYAYSKKHPNIKAQCTISVY